MPRTARPFLLLALLFSWVATSVPSVTAQGGAYRERAAEVGLTHEFVSGLDSFADAILWDTLQSGMAVGDLDGDGDLDVIAAGGVGPNRIFRNDGGSFTDVTPWSDIETGELERVPLLGDYDGDGDLDLFLGVLEGGNGDLAGRGRLFRNDGLGVFLDVTALAPTVGAGHTLFARWGDLDMDGLLDLYLGEFHGSRNRWYRNNGDGTMSEMAAAIGVDHGGATHAAASFDADDDGWIDLIVGNDYTVAKWVEFVTNAGDAHLQGLGDHTFLDVTEGSEADQEVGIMGIALGDVDYDGDLDMYKTDVRDNWLLLNEGWPGSGIPWERADTEYGIDNPYVPDPSDPTGEGLSVGWAAIFLNADFDPYLDLFLVNGKVGGLHPTNPYTPANQPNYLFHGDGPANDFHFTDRSEEFGFVHMVDDRGAAMGDLDGDGDADLIVSPTNGPLRYYENQVDREGQGTLIVRAECATSAPDGIGAVVSWTDSLGYPHLRTIGGDGPTASQHENAAFFTLGHETLVDVTVRFPSGLERVIPAVAANSEVLATEPELIRLPFRTRAIDAPVTAGSAMLVERRQRFTVEVAAHDPAGNPLDAGVDVTIEAGGLAAAGEVFHISGKWYGREFFEPGQPGSHRVRASFDGFQVRIEPQVHFYRGGDVSGSTVRMQPEAVRAGSSDLVEVQVVPKAAGGFLQASHGEVLVHLGGQTPLSTHAIPGGIQVFSFAAPSMPGTYAVDVTIGGIPAGPPLTLEAGGVPVKNQMGVTMEAPVQAQAAAPHQLKLLLTPRDAEGLRIGPYAALDLTPTPDAGSVAVVLRTDLLGPGQMDGDYVFVLEKPVGTPQGGAVGDFALTIDGVDLGTFGYSF